MSKPTAAADRLAAAGYRPAREREGCARCVFSAVSGEGDRKVYLCDKHRAQVSAGGHCQLFERLDGSPEPFRQVVMREVAAAIGHATAYQVVRRWGGRELRVPVTVDAHHPLALTLGLDAAHRLVRAFGGQRLDLPLEVNVLRQKRDQAIVRDRERGMSEERCAMTYGMTRQAVRAVIARMRALVEKANA